MGFIKRMIFTFVLALAGTTMSTALFITIFYSDFNFSVILVWEIIIMSAACSLGNLIFYAKKELSKQQMRLRMLLHYLYINFVVFGGALLWGWVKPGFLPQLVVMFLMITAVYIVVMYVNLKREEKTAEDLNKRLSKLNSGEEQKEE